MLVVARGVGRWVGAMGLLLVGSGLWARSGQAQQLPGGPPAGGGVTPMCAGGACSAAVYVTPVPASVVKGAGLSGQTAAFLVENTFAYDVEIGAVCSRTGQVTSCGNVTPTAFNLGSGASTTVQVTYATGTSGSGTVALTVYHDAGSGSPRTGTQAVTVNPPPPPPPIVALRNQPDRLERSLCLTAGAGEAAVQCGDLMVSHSMPAYRTLGRDRSLTLIYTSATAAPRPAVAVVVTPNSTGTTVEAVLKVGPAGGSQLQVASASYAGWGGPRQLVLTYTPASVDTTGLYDYTLEVRNVGPGGPSTPTTLTGQLVVVDRRTSPFGAGWALAGVEQLVTVAGGKRLWVGADGSARVYTSAGTNMWAAPPGAYRDTIVLAGGVYTRTLRHGVRVQYDGTGRHTKTINRTEQATTFGYTAARLTSITVPPTGTGGTYSLAYTGASMVLDKITDPAGRILDASVDASGRLLTLLDPDARAVQFGYELVGGRMVRRWNRLNHATRFEYIPTGERLLAAHVPYGPTGADTARTQYQAWDAKGLAVGPSNQVAIDTAQAVTKILGPRLGVNDDATFSVDRWGAPTKIVNALGATTRIKRASTVYPTLVTEITYPNNRVVTMRYDTAGVLCCRANLRIVRDSTSHLSNGLPTKGSEYIYGSAVPDSPLEVRDALGRATKYTYNGMGLLDSVVDPRGHVTKFWYDSLLGAPLRGSVLKVREEDVQTWEEAGGSSDDESAIDHIRDHETLYAYDARGNPDRITAPHGSVTTYANDPEGRTHRIWDPLGMVTELTFDPLNRVTEQRQFTSAYAYVNPYGISLATMTLDGTQVLPGDNSLGYAPSLPSVLTTYMRHSATTLDSLTGPLSPQATRRFLYDARGALASEKDELEVSGTIVRNETGQVTQSTLRSGHTTYSAYDEAGRLIARWYPARTMMDSTIPGDSVAYTYDPLTNDLLSATNRQGVNAITRTYYADGSVRTRTLTRGSLTNTAQYTYNAAGQRT